MKPSKKLSLVLLIAAAAFGCSSQTTSTPQTSETSVLRQEQSIQLPNVEGRIDHMAIDSQGGRLFVAALGNNTLEVIDLKASKVAGEIKDLKNRKGSHTYLKAISSSSPTAKETLWTSTMPNRLHFSTG
jgi:hypothetical protein